MTLRRFQEYDIPADEDVNAGDVRTMPDGSEWLVYGVVGHSWVDGMFTKYRITVIPNTPANRRRIAQNEQELG